MFFKCPYSPCLLLTNINVSILDPDSSLWSVRSDFQLCQDDIEDNFFDEVRNINILSHPDITTPLSGQDNIPTHLIPYEKKGIQISPIKKRFSLNRDRLPLPRKSSSSSSSIKVEMVHNQQTTNFGTIFHLLTVCLHNEYICKMIKIDKTKIYI